MPARAVEQHHRADDQDRKADGLQDLQILPHQHLQRNQHAAQQDHPQGSLLKDAVQHLPGPLLLQEGDDHAHVQVDDAEHHGAVEHQLALVHRVEQIGQALEGGIGIDHLRDDLRGVAEEAAGEGAHDEGADAAVEQQLAKGQGALAGLDLLHGDQSRRDHDEAVAHVRHHQAVKQDEEGSHDGVCVHGAVSREAVHVGHHVQGVGKLVVLELDGYLRVLVLTGLAELPGAFKALQKGSQLLLPLRRDPARQHHGGAGAIKPLLRLGHADAGGKPVIGQLQFLPVGSLGGDLLGQAHFFLHQGLDSFLCRGDVLFGGAGAAVQAHRAEAEVPQALLGSGQLLLGREQQHILLALILTHWEEFRLLGLFRKGLAHLLERNAAAQRSQKQRAALGALGLQGQVQALPGRQALDERALPALLGGDAADPVLPLVYGGSKLQSLVQPFLRQQHAALHFGLGTEQGRFLRGVALQQLHGPLQGGLLGFELAQLAPLPAHQALAFLLLNLLGDLADLDAAQARKLLQQFFLLGTDQHQPQAFHFQNGHVSRSLSFLQ